MVVNCEQVWREISNYLDGEVEPGLRTAMDGHIATCQRCSAVLAGTRNVVELYGDERMVEMPLGFSYRLQRRLDENAHPSRRTFFGWMVAAAAAVLVVGSFEAARSSGIGRTMRTEHAQPGSGVPPDMMVLVYPDGKTFHVAGCTYILDKTHLRSVTAHKAMREGYVPCIRCMAKYLNEKA
jgi:hypothetical protein